MNKAKKITISALFALAIISLISGVLFFTLKSKKQPLTPEIRAEGKDSVTDENGVNLMDGKYHSLPAKMLFTPAPLAASTVKTFSVNLAVTVTPTTAAAKPVDWSVSFVNADSEWASGKTVTDYVTVTPTVDGAKTATATCLKAFGEQIIITVTARENPNATATSLLDYKQQLLSYDLSVAQEGKSPTVNVSSKSGKLVADVESKNEIIFGYSYRKSDVYTVALEDSEIAKPTAMSLSYKTALAAAMNNVKQDSATAPIATATENGFKVTGFLNRKAVNGLSIENHNKIIAAINTNYYFATSVELIDSNGNTLTKYTFDVDTSLVKQQGKIENLSMDKTSFVFDESQKEYKITYLRGQSTSKLGLFEKGSEYGRSKIDGGSYPETYTPGNGNISVSTLKTIFYCGGEYHSGNGMGSAEYKFGGWYLDWNLTQPFNGTISGNSAGDIVLYAKITMLSTHAY